MFLKGLILFLIKKILISIIRLYQLLLSPFLGNNCRFLPSCSNYSIEAINEYGVFKGLYLAIKRILKCHPWGSYGYDSVKKE